MKKKNWYGLHYIFAIISLILCIAPNTYAANDAVEDALTSVVRVVHLLYYKGDEYLTAYHGTGFGVGRSQSQIDYIVTNKHVVIQDMDDNISIYLNIFHPELDKIKNQEEISAKINKILDEENEKIIEYISNIKSYFFIIADGIVTEIPSKDAIVSKDYDLAALRTPSGIKNRKPIQFAKSEDIKVTDTVYSLGFPGIADFVVKKGNDFKDKNSTALSIYGKSAISEITVNTGNISRINPDNIYTGAKGGNDTIDWIFLLSMYEVNYFSNTSMKICKPTEYAKSQGAWISKDVGYEGNGYWWLRTPGTYYSTNGTLDESFVNAYGIIMYSGSSKGNDAGLIRPAFWLSLEKTQSDSSALWSISDQIKDEIIDAAIKF